MDPMGQPLFNVNHRYNTTDSTVQSQITTKDISSMDYSSSNSSNKQSFRQQIEMILSRCHQLQHEKRQQYQTMSQSSEPLSNVDQSLTQQSTHIVEAHIKTYERDDFDRIMEEDLENQLNELEREEEKQYQLLEQSIEEEFKQNQSFEFMNRFTYDYVQQLKNIETLIHIEQKQHEKQYETLLKQMKTYEHDQRVNRWKIFGKLPPLRFQQISKYEFHPIDQSTLKQQQQQQQQKQTYDCEYHQFLEFKSTMLQLSNEPMILMSYNETKLTQFSIPINHDLTYRMYTNNNMPLRILKQQMDTLNNTFLSNLHRSSSTVAQEDANNTIYDRYFIFIIVGLLFLILLNLIVIIRQIGFKSSFIRNKRNGTHFQNYNHSHSYRPEDSNGFIPSQILEYIQKSTSTYSMKQNQIQSKSVIQCFDF